jgi:HAD superfamily hydrolase (TIGR01490 family)
MTAAFFDLDRTLIDCNSGVLYARFERRGKRISRRQLAMGLTFGVLYHFDMVDIDAAMGKALEHYKGVTDEELRERTRVWFADEVVDRLRPGARRALDAHRGLGHPLVMLTNSSCYMADIATEVFGLDDWLANSFVVDGDGRLTGEFEKPLCYGAGKAERALKWATERGEDLAECYFYTDSLSDLPMLEAVGMPRVVHPDPKLKREAKRRGWTIEDWR